MPLQMQLNKLILISTKTTLVFNKYFNSVFATDFCILPDLETILCPPKYIDNTEFPEAEMFEA